MSQTRRRIPDQFQQVQLRMLNMIEARVRRGARADRGREGRSRSEIGKEKGGWWIGGTGTGMKKRHKKRKRNSKRKKRPKGKGREGERKDGKEEEGGGEGDTSVQPLPHQQAAATLTTGAVSASRGGRNQQDGAKVVRG